MPAFTPIFGFYVPTVGGDGDAWGGYLNGDIYRFDGLFNTAINSITDSVSSGPVSITSADKNKLILVDATSAPIAINFAACALLGDGFKVSIKKVDSTANAVTLNPNGSETIDGGSSYVLSEENAAVTVGTDGNDLFVISTNAEIGAATTTTAGIVRLATIAETETGTDATIAVTPAGLSGAIDTILAGVLITPTIQVKTATGTWTRPTGCKKIKVTVVGGGSSSNTVATPGTPTPTSGTSSSFGSHCSATGGSTTGGIGSSGDLNFAGGTGSAMGKTTGSTQFIVVGGSSFFGGGSGDANAQNYGSGAGVAVPNNSNAVAGSAGGTSIKYIDVSAISSVAVTVGAGGLTSSGAFNGAPGVVVIEEYYA